jgi:membrane fusion protein, multidrug efflux system
VNARSCARSTFGRSVPIALSIIVLASGCSPKAPSPTEAARPVMKAVPGVNLLPGMTGSVTLTFHRASILGDQILVPITAVIKESTGAQVAWAIEPDGNVTRRPVKTGEVTGDSIVILEGLQPGDRIAVAGVPFLRDGMKVRDLGNELAGNRP